MVVVIVKFVTGKVTNFKQVLSFACRTYLPCNQQITFNANQLLLKNFQHEKQIVIICCNTILVVVVITIKFITKHSLYLKQSFIMCKSNYHYQNQVLSNFGIHLRQCDPDSGSNKQPSMQNQLPHNKNTYREKERK